MPPKNPSNSEIKAKNCQGFILLEVLVAMSLISGVWISLVGAYQRLALSLVQHDAKRTQVREEWDVFEIQEHGRGNFSASSKGISNDFARVPNRHRSLRTTNQSTLKDKR